MTEGYYNVEEMRLHLKGHAGAAPAGQDIVCAGISTLCFALINTLLEEQEAGTMETDWNITQAPMEVSVRARPRTAHYRRRAQDYFRVIVMGLRAMEQEYPQNLRLEEVREGGNH